MTALLLSLSLILAQQVSADVIEPTLKDSKYFRALRSGSITSVEELNQVEEVTFGILKDGSDVVFCDEPKLVSSGNRLVFSSTLTLEIKKTELEPRASRLNTDCHQVHLTFACGGHAKIKPDHFQNSIISPASFSLFCVKRSRKEQVEIALALKCQALLDDKNIAVEKFSEQWDLLRCETRIQILDSLKTAYTEDFFGSAIKY